jgi:hypothetical protein
LVDLLTAHVKVLAKAAGEDGKRRPLASRGAGPGVSPAAQSPGPAKLSFDAELVAKAREQTRRRSRRRLLWRLIPLAVMAVIGVLSYAHVRQVNWGWYRQYIAPRLPSPDTSRPSPPVP